MDKAIDLLEYYNDCLGSDFTDLDVAETFFEIWRERQSGFEGIYAVKRCIGVNCYHTRQLPNSD